MAQSRKRPRSLIEEDDGISSDRAFRRPKVFDDHPTENDQALITGSFHSSLSPDDIFTYRSATRRSQRTTPNMHPTVPPAHLRKLAQASKLNAKQGAVIFDEHKPFLPPTQRVSVRILLVYALRANCRQDGKKAGVVFGVHSTK